MQLTSLPNSLRPREKLIAKGPKALTDAELLAIFLRTGLPGMNVIELAQHRTHGLDLVGGGRHVVGLMR